MSQNCTLSVQEATRKETREASSHLYVIPEEARRHHRRRPDEGQPDELPELLWPLRQQDFDRLPHVRHDEEPRSEVPLLQAHAGAAQHHPIHCRRVHRRHPVGHEPAIAYPHEAEAPHAGGLHCGCDAAGLVGLGPVGAEGLGGAKEEEVGNVEVEAGAKERAEVGGPLPDGGGAEAVEEEERGPGGIRAGGDPAVDGGAIGEGGGGGTEAGAEEGSAVAPVSGDGEAEAPWHLGCRDLPRPTSRSGSLVAEAGY